MKLFQFLESKYVTTNLESQKEYSPYKMASTRAVQNLINGQRRVFMWLAYATLITEYFLVTLRLIKRPMTVQELSVEARKKTEEALQLKKEAEDKVESTLPKKEDHLTLINT